MRRVKLNKTITFTDEDIKKIRMYLNNDDELEKIEEWDFNDLIDAITIKNDFITIILKYLLIKENAETIFNTK